MANTFGQYGGRVLRPFKGDGQQFVSGAVLTPEMVESWPVANRVALANCGSILWYDAPDEEETAARTTSRKPPVAKAPVAVPAVKSKRTK